MPVKELITSAIEARKKAYTPYSHFKVGAAVLTGELRIYTGCNIENAAYSPGICAERNAIYKAVSEGARKLKAIAVVGDKEGDAITQYAFPCGVCRQVMREFCNPDEMMVIVAKSCEEYQTYTLNQLLPESFGPDHLK
ncbi:MAG: cytidine deaminase [Lachnospiraceae bacterium]|nr:cytidine deaminase [Lachnospiraceae bacterium]